MEQSVIIKFPHGLTEIEQQAIARLFRQLFANTAFLDGATGMTVKHTPTEIDPWSISARVYYNETSD